MLRIGMLKILCAMLLQYLINNGNTGLYAQAKFFGIGDVLGGDVGSWAFGVSSDGKTVIGSSMEDSNEVAVYWNSDEKIIHALGVPDEVNFSQARGVSSNGDHIVGYCTIKNKGTTSFRWDLGTGFSLFVQQPTNSWVHNEAYGISADGSTIIGKIRASYNRFHGFRYRLGNLDTLPLPTDFIEGDARGISGDGSIIAGYAFTYNNTYPNPAQALAWNDALEFKELSRGLSVRAFGVSEDGKFAVGYNTSSAYTDPMYWATDGSISGTLPRYYQTPYAVSGDGTVIVGWTAYTSPDGYQAFVSVKSYGTRLVKDVLEKEYGLNLTGWQLQTATGVSKDGSVIVGTGINPSGKPEGWWAYVPYIAMSGPYERKTLTSFTRDTLTWRQAGNQHLNIYLSLDSGKTKQTLVANVDATLNKFDWEVPDTVSYDCVIIIQGVEDPAVKDTSDVFRIRGFRLLRNDIVGNGIELFKPDVHGWQFPNQENSVWPAGWWGQFNYWSSIDPYTGKVYPHEDPFLNAPSWIFPDWPLFVRIYSEWSCYYSTTLGLYAGSAEKYWESTRSKWGGSCYGFATSSLIAFNYPSDIQTAFHEMPPPTRLDGQYELFNLNGTDSTRQIVNYLQNCQSGNPHKTDYANNLKTPKETLEELRQMLQGRTQNKVIGMGPKNDDGGHAVTPYRIGHDNAVPNIFKIYVYDSNLPGDKNAFITVDTSANTWTYTNLWNITTGASWTGWGQWSLRLHPPAVRHLTPPYLPKRNSSDPGYREENNSISSQFLAASNTFNFYLPSEGTHILITDTAGHQMGYLGSDSLIEEIPGGGALRSEVRMINESTFGSSSPYGYLIPKGNYSINISHCPDTSYVFNVFTDSLIFSYRRNGGVDSSQTDKLRYTRQTAPMSYGIQSGRGLTVINSDGVPKIFSIESVIPIPTYYGEQQFYINNLHLEPGDSVKVVYSYYFSDVGVQNFGIHPISYDLSLRSIGYFSGQYQVQRFDRYSIPLGANSNHMIDPSWWGMQNQDLHIAVDTGNVGSYDNDIYVSNQMTGIGNEIPNGKVPTSFALMQNYPNPFNPTTDIQYAIVKPCFTTLKVYNVLGHEVATLVNEVKQPGTYTITWNASSIPAGVYFYRLSSGSFVDTKKLILIK